MTGLVNAAMRVLHAMKVIVERIIETIKEVAEGREQVAAESQDAGQLDGQIVPPRRLAGGKTFECVAPPLNANPAQHWVGQ